jgi:5-hydroxyisourate hydrolase-like protein (transthyretin family)
MSTSKIIVYRNGRPAQNIKVSLEYTGFTQSGFTQAHYTNSDGIAHVEHSSTGTAHVYLNGSKKGSMSTPGTESFYL